MTPKISSKPTIEGIRIFQGLKPAAGGGIGAGSGGRAIGVVTRGLTRVSSSRSSVNSWEADFVDSTTRVLWPDGVAVISVPAAIVKSSTNSPTVWYRFAGTFSIARET